MKNILALFILLASIAFAFSCGDSPAAQNDASLQNPGDTPTEAYKRLYAAVKSKNTEAIKREVSQKTQSLAEMLAARQKKSLEEVYANGFTGTTFSPTLPEMRDERVKDDMGALEVWNSTDKKWEDLPFIREETGWKLAIGDIFANTYRLPGKGRDTVEREAANAASGTNGLKPIQMPANANFNGLRPPIPQNK